MVRTIVLTALVALVALTGSVGAQVRVRGYYRSDGTYVAPHYRSYPDGNFYNNWSAYPNVNPYTGQMGMRATPPLGYGGYTIPSYTQRAYPQYTTQQPSFSYPSFTRPSFPRYRFQSPGW